MLSQIREKYEADQQVQLSRTKISLINSQIIDNVDTSELKAMMGKRQEILDQEDKLLLSIEQCLKEWNTNIKFVVQNEEQILQMNKEIENHQTKIMLSKFLIKAFQLKQENIVQHKKSTKIQQQIKADAKKGIEEYGIISDHVKDQQKQIKGWRLQIQQQRNKIISQYPVMIYNDLIQRIPKNYDQKNDPCGIIETFENIKLEFQECIKLAQAWFDKDDACEIFQQQQKDEEQFKQMSKVTAETCKNQINFYAQQLQQLEIQQKILKQNFDQQQLLFKKELILYLKQEFKTLKSQQELEMVDSQLYYYEFIKSALNYSEQIKMNQIYQCSTQKQQITDTIQNYENRIHQLSQILKDSNQKLENSSIQALSIINNHQVDQWQRFNYQSLFDEVCQLIRQNQPQYDEQIEQLFQQLQEQYYKLQYQKEKQQEFQNEISLQRQQQRYVCLIQQTNNQKIKKISNKVDELRDQQYSLNNRILNDQQQKVIFSQQLGQANELQKQIINGVKQLTLKSKRAPYKLKDDKIYEHLNKMAQELYTIECSINEAQVHKSINELMLKHYERAHKEPLNDAQLQQSPQKSLLLQKQDMKEIEKQIQQVRRNISKVRDFLISNIMSTKEKSLIKYVEILKEFLQFDFDYLVDDVRRNENILKLNHQIKTATLKLQQSQTLLLIENSNMDKLTKFSEQALAIFNQSLTAQLNEVVGDIQNNQNLIQVEQQQIDVIKQKIYKQSQNRPMILKVFHKIYSHLDENCSQKIKQYHNEFEVINMEISQFLDKQQKIKQKRQQLKQKQQDSKQDYFDSKLEQSRIKCQLDLQEQAQNCNINIEEEVFQAVTKQIFDKYKRI